MRCLFLVGIFFLIPAAMAQQKETHKGNLRYLQKDYLNAENLYRKALEKDSAHTVARFNLGNTLYKQKRFDEAAALFGSLAGENGNKQLRSSAWYNQGLSYTRQNNLAAAIESYKQALRLNPNDIEARENLQKALREQKKQQQKQQPRSKMSQKEAEQKLRMLQQKEKQIQERMQKKAPKTGDPQGQDW